MNPVPGSIPGFQSLYRSDLILQRVAKAGVFALIVAAGVRWAAPVAPHPDPAVDLSVDIAIGQWVPVGALVVAVLATLIFFWRYLRLKKILGEGIVVQAMVEDLIVHAWKEGNSSGSRVIANNRHSYYAVLRYAVHGVDYKVCLKMPNSGTTYGIVKGNETEISVLSWKPKKPLLRAIYFRRSLRERVGQSRR